MIATCFLFLLLFPLYFNISFISGLHGIKSKLLSYLPTQTKSYHSTSVATTIGDIDSS